jgi:hypothetical protein
MKPFLGESVIFVGYQGQNCAAVVTYVYEDDPDGAVDLTIFYRLRDSIPGSSGAVPKGYVEYSEVGKTETWDRSTG